ncbi:MULTISPECIES: MurR/RpiR family transcriptional regulator [unclassified Caballeronia]|uniref:MurR/RpiR family transcriptional regulator n=1 Tax=unclassified Caballeronia TaxID=2646786 RepID=UPI002866B346|nr:MULTISPECIES: MurR/RpiR family transcriptional regulator [unclassified Caballeronia]MDR5739786.1 MurR/RpiR family transcriptional regulator [Caballeronia sp. LZ016]MDR5808250.1 MurR/RpiR family transcriptional regulator [Caballeronia sp. LZ019]
MSRRFPVSPPMTADEPIATRIATAMPTLTPIHQRMGAFVMANLFRSATMRIDEFADAVGASIATANRFARALGFSGYPAFRDALVRGFEATIAPVERLRSSLETSVSGAEVFQAALVQAASNVRLAQASVDASKADTLVDALLDAHRVFVLGYGASAFLAGLMEHGLTPYCANVQSLALVGGPSHAARRLFTASREDVLVAIAFPRYVDDTITLARQAREHGVRVVALTDSGVSPLARVADLVLTIPAERRLAANCDTAVLAVIEALCDAVAHRAKRSVEAASGLAECVLPWLATASTGQHTRREPRES